jgi:hypothetical protein
MQLVRDMDESIGSGDDQERIVVGLAGLDAEAAYTGPGLPPTPLPGTFYFAAKDAPACPRLLLSSRFSGVVPAPQFDLQRHVTIIFLAGTVSPVDQALFPYGRDLLKRKEYRRPDNRGSIYPELQAKAIIERTERAEKIGLFFRLHHIKYPYYYDGNERESHKALAKAVGADSGVWPVTCILDRKGRIRFYRTGFRSNIITHSARAGYEPKTRDAEVTERAPVGHRISDYLDYILKNP